MKSLKKVMGFIGLLLLWVAGHTQNLSNRGKEFWVGYGHHQFMEPGQNNSQQMILYFSAEQPANVKVSINGTAWVRNYSIPANTVIASDFLPKAGTDDCRLYSVPPTFGGTGGEGVFNRGIHIESNVPIVAYAHIYGSASSGATMLMPVETYGYSYVSINSEQRFASNCFSWIYVVAKENNTRIEITPSVATRNGRTPGVPFQVDLQKGQIYQVVGAMKGGNEGYELTGTKVKSIANDQGECYPVGVFAGSSRTYICGSSGGDNIMQQIFPFQAWGKRYLTSPTSTASNASALNKNIYRVAVKDPTTKVKVNGVPLAGLINSFYYEFQSSTADYIEADKPILVAQYIPSSSGCSGYTGVGDPEMMYISPIEQAIKRIGFYRNNEENIAANYLTLIIPSQGVSSLKIDGQSSFDYSYAHPNLSGYTVVVKRWSAAQAQCIVQSDSAFTAITYGLGSVESYGYNAGTMINNLNAIGAIHNTLNTDSTTNSFTCTNTPLELSVYMAYKPNKMVWKLSELGAVLSPNTDVTVNTPIEEEIVLVKGVPYYRYTLPGDYSFNTPGTYDVPILSTHPSIENCNNTERVTFEVIVKGRPLADFTFEHSGCITDTIRFNAATSSTNGFEVDRWKWTFPDGSTTSIQAPSKVFGTIGIQNVKLEVVTPEGCVSDIVKPITIFNRPVATVDAIPASLCVGNTLSLTETSSFDGPAALNSWYWDFGNGTNLTASNANTQTHSYNTPGDYTVKHVAKLSNTCISDTAVKIVKVYARPVASFTYPVGCLPADGIVQFNSTSSTPDGQSITSYSWDFGDGNATSTNPNTSTLQNPTHTYSSFGTYTIKHTVITANGCTKDTVVIATLNLKPVLSYTSLPPACENITAVSVATATVTNGVTGTGVYRGPSTTAAGSFNPALAGAGTHTIWYVFTSNAGCKDSISQTVTVYPKPAAAFSITADICLDKTATITDQSSIVSGSITSWDWNFGDGSAPVTNTSNASFVRSFASQGNYMVKLVTTSDRGCNSDTAKKSIIVHPLPVTAFDLPAGVCMPNGSAVFANRTTVGDNSALTYQWSFGDGLTGSTATNPSHVYAASGSYDVKLAATSVFGCVKEETKTLSAFYDKPIALFEVSPDTLCQGAENRFADHSSAPNSTIQAWQWNFDDGTTSTANNPSKRFSQPGNYKVQLVVTNTVGCKSDPHTKSVKVYLQPVIDAGPSFVVPQGTTIQFNPKVNDSVSVSFAWDPSTGLNDPTALRPVLVALRDETYTLTATGEGNCTAKDQITVKILKPVKIPNAFSPNGDGINDRWDITNLSDYPGATVEVFNRFGQPVFFSKGYNDPWDGKNKGNALPVATYYYVITLKNGFQPITGSLTIVR
jgi:gliding motility-associated-like protein